MNNEALGRDPIGSYTHLLRLARKLSNFYHDVAFPNERYERVRLTPQDFQVLFCLVMSELRRMYVVGEEAPVSIFDLKPDFRR